MVELRYLCAERSETHYFVHLTTFTGVNRFAVRPVEFLYHGDSHRFEDTVLEALSKVFKEQHNQNIGRFIVLGEPKTLFGLLRELYDYEYTPSEHEHRLHLCAEGDTNYEVKLAVLITDGDAVYQLMLDSFATPVFAQIQGERVS